MSPPLMRRVRERMLWMLEEKAGDVIIDAPPGTSCPAMQAVHDADPVLLVTEPTPFGLYDLDLARRAFAPTGKRMAVIINRAGFDDAAMHAYCGEHGLPVIAEFPFERRIAEAYARGIPLDRISPRHRNAVAALRDAVAQLLSTGRARETADA
jgi:MinD superfamily P-loop ATPase